MGCGQSGVLERTQDGMTARLDGRELTLRNPPSTVYGERVSFVCATNLRDDGSEKPIDVVTVVDDWPVGEPTKTVEFGRELSERARLCGFEELPDKPDLEQLVLFCWKPYGPGPKPDCSES